MPKMTDEELLEAFDDAPGFVETLHVHARRVRLKRRKCEAFRNGLRVYAALGDTRHTHRIARLRTGANLPGYIRALTKLDLKVLLEVRYDKASNLFMPVLYYDESGQEFDEGALEPPLPAIQRTWAALLSNLARLAGIEKEVKRRQGGVSLLREMGADLALRMLNSRPNDELSRWLAARDEAAFDALNTLIALMNVVEPRSPVDDKERSPR